MQSRSHGSGAEAIAAARVGAVQPVLGRISSVRDVLPGIDRTVWHAGPPYARAELIPRPVLNSMCVACVFESWADDVTDAERLLLAGDVRTAAAQDHDLLVPLAGVLTPSMAVLDISDAHAHGTVGPGRSMFVALHEGPIHATRLGRLDPELPSHLRWLHTTLRDALEPLCDPPLRLLPLIEAALRQGDECHARTVAGSALLQDCWRARGGRDTVVDSFLAQSPAFALSFWMGAAALGASAAVGLPGVGFVTHAGGNGREFGIKLSGSSSEWVRCPAPPPAGPIDPACSAATPVGALGDSAIVDFAGLGAQALRHAPRLRESLAAHLPANILLRPGLVLSGIDTDSAWRPRATDARRCVEAGTGPAVLIGMIDAAGQLGRIGAGVVDVPTELFARALNLPD